MGATGVTLKANIFGGGQELGLRSGTENVAGVVGFATALELAQKRRSAEVKRLRKLREELARDLKQAFPEMFDIVRYEKKFGEFSEYIIFWN